MKPLHISLSLLVAVAGIIYIVGGDSQPGRVSTEDKNPVTTETPPSPSPTTHPSGKAALTPSSGTEPSVKATEVVRGEDKEKLIENFPKWATTYDKPALDKVKDYVYSADPEIRAAAVDAIVAIGISEGADVLEDALRSMTVPEEIVETKAKIKFLRLPSALPR